MTIFNEIQHTEQDKLNELFVGRKVISTHTDTDKYGFVDAVITLDNGVKMIVKPNDGGCCGKGDYVLEALNFVDNVITSVEVQEDSFSDGKYSVKNRYSLFIYTAGIITDGQKLLSVVGQCGEGYYGDGFRVNVEITEK